ncbi:MAG: 7-carboxy-7-deazaguanine synthase QueE [Psittacicella sp.]
MNTINLLKNYNIVEIFSSLQGEGFNSGMPTTFIRFGRCNLACPWCDTDYNTYKSVSLSFIIEKVKEFGNPNIILTGGEPTIQKGFKDIVDILKSMGYFVAVETNGLKKVYEKVDYVATSPKRIYFDKYKDKCISKASEIRVVCDGSADEVIEFCLFLEGKITAENYFLSPCEVDDSFNMLDTLKTLYKLNQVSSFKWYLSIQSHKIAGIE